MLRVAFLNVGQGDTIIIHNPETDGAIVVDCLNPLSVLDYLQCEKIRQVRAVILTHLHSDHYEGTIQFLDACRTRGISWNALYFYWVNNTRQRKHLLHDSDGHSNCGEDNADLCRKKRMSTYQSLARWSKNRSNGERILSPDRLDGIDCPGIKLERLHPLHSQIGYLESAGINNVSVVLRVSDGETSALLLGDLEPQGWDLLSGNTMNLSGDVLKFPHHGAWKRNDVDAMLDLVSPTIVVMSVGTVGEKYGHPDPHVFAELRCRKGVKVVCTQATKQCVPEPSTVQARVSTLLAKVGSRFDELAVSPGCPCASTVVVELGKDARIVHPPHDTHRQIIEECFPLAQCRKD